VTKKPAIDKNSSPETQGSARSGQDVVLIAGLSEDKKGLRVLRARNDQVEAGEVRPLVEGQPITSDVVRLKPRAGMPLLCDVETEVAISNPQPTQSKSNKPRSGPAQVANRAYRDNWDTIWSRSTGLSGGAGSSAVRDPSKLN